MREWERGGGEGEGEGEGGRGPRRRFVAAPSTFSSATTRSRPESPKLESTSFAPTISSRHWYTCLRDAATAARAYPSGTPTPTPHAYSVAGKGRGRTALREGGGTWSPPETAGTPRGLAPICSPASPPAAGPPWGTGRACAASSQRLAARRARLKVRSGERRGVGCRVGRWGRSTTGRQVCGARCSSCRQSRAVPGECPRARVLATHFASRSEQRTFAPSPLQWAQQAATRTQQRARRGQADASAPAAASESWRWPRPRKAFWHRRSAC